MRRAAPPISHVLWRFALSIAVLIPLAVDAAEPAAVAPSSEAAGSPQSTLSYRVTVDAPSPLKETLMREVGLARWQGYSEMTEDLLARLAREAIEETRTFAAAEGYFSAAIDVKIDRSTNSDRRDARREHRRADEDRVGAHRRERTGDDGRRWAPK